MKHPYLTKFRKALALTAMLLLLISLTGCWKKDEPDSTDDTSGQVPPASSSVPPEASSQAPPAPSSEAPPTETDLPATEAPTTAPSETPTQPPATEAPAEKVMGTVTAAKLNIRSNAGVGYTSVGSYYNGDRVEILETRNGWGRTDKGWIYLDYVKLGNDATGQNNENTSGGKDLVSDDKTTPLGYGVVTMGTLNVRSGPGTNYEKIDTVSYGSRYAYYQQSNNWARIDKGWVSLSYLYIEGTAGEGAGTGYIHSADPNIRTGPGLEYERVGNYKNGYVVEILMQINKWGCTDKGWVSMSYVAMKEHPTGTGTVTPETLNIRKLAKVDSEKVGTYSKGDKIEILETNGDWGRTDKGWVYLDYVKMDAAARTVSEPERNAKTGTGTVTASALRIRKDANINAEAVGAYAKGDKIEILETKNGWGRTDKGWISMDYVKLDM